MPKAGVFYFSEYVTCPQRNSVLPQKVPDVCDQIMFHLIVIKEPMSDAECQSMAEKVECYEPQFVTIRQASGGRAIGISER